MPTMLICILTLVCILKYKLHKNQREERIEEETYLQVEKRASLPIKKSLDSLPFITIPVDQLPFQENPTPKIAALEHIIRELATLKICNFRGISNTDLKLRYGAGNLPLLAEYEQNYIKLIKTLADWCEELANSGLNQDAITVAVFAIDLKTDIRKTYTVLAQIYKQENRLQELYDLLPVAASLSDIIDLKKAVYDVINAYESDHNEK